MSRVRAWLTVLAVLLASVGAGALLRSRVFDTATPPAASAERLACDQLIQSFDAYPLFNLGEEFEGLPLARCTRSQTPAKFDQEGNVREPATDFVFFIYGECTPPPTGEGCVPPIQVFSDPPCGPKLVEAAKSGIVQVRGASVIVKLDGSVRIENPGYSVTIYATTASDPVDKASQTDTALRAAAALRGANALAAQLSSGQALDANVVTSGTYCQ